ncbi:MAG: 6-pyruvoyl-tetrahydropterin synthase-related protein [Acidobacteriota bacterium]|nr:6-pyruvoyl-tetrahydropterin synthase-related protein [Acidobacteriota bacterium]
MRRIFLRPSESGERSGGGQLHHPTSLSPPLAPWPLFIIMITALAVVLPFLHFGIPSGHDFEFHMNSWIEVAKQWKQGILHPHWAALAHYGYGEARFIFYPPASWTLGASLGLLIPWKLVPAAYIWIALTLSGCSMFLLARRWLPGWDATFAAAFFTANPYHLVIVYWRSAFAELLAAALLPSLILIVFRIAEAPPGKRLRATLALAIVLAVAWLTNIPSAVMATYSLGSFAVLLAITRRSWRILLYMCTALLLAAGLAAFYITPVMAEQKWVNLSQVLAPGVRPEDNFLFTVLDDPDHNVFNFLVSLVAVAEIAVLALAALVLFRRRTHESVEWWYVFAWGAAAAVPMVSFTLPAWRHLPELRFVQLPWRWLLCLNVAMTITVASAWRSWISRALVVLAVFSTIVFVWHRVLPPWWDNSGDIAEMLDDQESGKGYEGVDEYVPAGADAYDTKQEAPPVEFVSRGKSADIPSADDERASNAISKNVREWSPETKSFIAKLSRPGTLVLKLFNYPAWNIEVNGLTVHATSDPITGQMEIPVLSGTNRVNITFIRTRDRAIGATISAATMCLLLFLFTLRWKFARQLAQEVEG